MSIRNFPFLIVCSLLIGLIAVIGFLVFEKIAAQNLAQKHFSLTLQIGESKYFPDKKTKVNLQQITLAQPNQKDGLSQIQIVIEKVRQKENLVFKIGGFAGFDVRELNFSAGLVKLTNIQKNQVQLDIVLNE